MFRTKKISHHSPKQTHHRYKPVELANTRRPAHVAQVNNAAPAQVNPETLFSDESDHRWQIIVMLLILCPYLVRSATSPYAIQNQRLRDGNLYDITRDVSKCKINNDAGIGTHSSKDRMICEMQNDNHVGNYYIKTVPVSQTSLSLEIYNQEIANTIGISTTHPTLFTMHDRVVVATEEKNIKFVTFPTNKNNVAKFLVGLSFITDLNRNNWGEDSDGNLILIDIDGGHYVKKSVDEYILAAHENFKMYLPAPLSANVLKEMIEIYSSIALTPLPEFSEDFYVTHALRLNFINLFIKICRESIRASVRTHHLALDQEDEHVANEFMKRVKDEVDLRGKPSLQQGRRP